MEKSEMREILFRGKRVIDGRWVESCCPLGEMHSGTVTYDFDSKTVCQYTGLIDKNSRKIFEGDIVRHFNQSEDDKKYVIGCIKWDQNSCEFMNEHEDGIQCSINKKCIYEIIGNIFDNPELLR